MYVYIYIYIYIYSNNSPHICSHFGFKLPGARLGRGPALQMGPWSAAQNVMFEAAEQEVAKKTKNFGGTRLRKRDTDDQVDRSLKTHFFGWTSLEVDGHQVDGHTLRQQLLADKRAVKAGIMARLGSSYWKDMQAKFAGPDRPTRALTIANPTEMCNTTLMFALEMATHNNTTLKSRAPMVQYFASSDSVNQKEYVGILRHMLEVRPNSSTAATAFHIGFMKFCIRHQLNTKYPNETNQVKDLMDQAIGSLTSKQPCTQPFATMGL